VRSAAVRRTRPAASALRSHGGYALGERRGASPRAAVAQARDLSPSEDRADRRQVSIGRRARPRVCYRVFGHRPLVLSIVPTGGLSLFFRSEAGTTRRLRTPVHANLQKLCVRHLRTRLPKFLAHFGVFRISDRRLMKRRSFVLCGVDGRSIFPNVQLNCAVLIPEAQRGTTFGA
jgi:hypothetical protein